MKPTVLLALAAGFAAGALVTVASTDAFARPVRVPAPSAYTNGVYGYSLVPPTFAKADPESSSQTAMFFAPARNGFACNLGVMVQTVKMTLDEYIKLSRGQFEQGGLKVSAETKLKVSGRDAVFWEYEGSAQGRKLKFMAQAVVDGDRIFLITGTAPRDDYEAASKEFKASVDSFRIAD
jgi:hypothetical protein